MLWFEVVRTATELVYSVLSLNLKELLHGVIGN